MPAAVVAGAAVVGSLISSNAASSAARSQANALRDAEATTRGAADVAKAEILDRMEPALADYGASVINSRNEIISGATDVMNILNQSTGAASQILNNSGANARQALLGSQAISQGVPYTQFQQQFDSGVLGGGIQTGEQEIAGTEGFAQARQTADAEAARDAAVNTAANNSYDAALRNLGPRPTGMDAFESGATRRWDQQKAALGMQRDSGGFDAVAGEPGGPALDVDSYREGTVGPATRDIADPFSMTNNVSAVYDANSPTGLPQPGAVAPTGMPQPQIGFAGADTRIQEGLQGSLGALARGANMARGDITSGRDAALDRFSPYSQAGQGAIQQEAAMSGALGPEAQREAINAYMESPGQKYLREQQERALLRNTAAIGGLGGGNVRTALQEQAMGIASTQQQQHLENLRSLATRGQQVAGAEAGIITDAGTQLAQIAQQLGMSAADLMRMSASERAQLAERTGINLAQLEQSLGAAQSGLASNLGNQAAGVRGSAAGDLASLAERAGTTNLLTNQNISSQLANLATGSGSQVANLQALGGATQAAGTMGAANALAQGVTGLGAAGAYGMNNYQQVPTTMANAAITSPNVGQNLTPINQPGPVHVGSGGTTAWGL